MTGECYGYELTCPYCGLDEEIEIAVYEFGEADVFCPNCEALESKDFGHDVSRWLCSKLV